MRARAAASCGFPRRRRTPTGISLHAHEAVSVQATAEAVSFECDVELMDLAIDADDPADRAQRNLRVGQPSPNCDSIAVLVSVTRHRILLPVVVWCSGHPTLDGLQSVAGSPPTRRCADLPCRVTGRGGKSACGRVSRQCAAGLGKGCAEGQPKAGALCVGGRAAAGLGALAAFPRRSGAVQADRLRSARFRRFATWCARTGRRGWGRRRSGFEGVAPRNLRCGCRPSHRHVSFKSTSIYRAARTRRIAFGTNACEPLAVWGPPTDMSRSVHQWGTGITVRPAPLTGASRNGQWGASPGRHR